MSIGNAIEIPLTPEQQVDRQERIKIALNIMHMTTPDGSKLITTLDELEDELYRRFSAIQDEDGMVEDVASIEMFAECVKDGIMLGIDALKLCNEMINQAEDEIASQQE